MPSPNSNQPRYAHLPNPVNGYTIDLDAHVEYIVSSSAISEPLTPRDNDNAERPPSHRAQTIQANRSADEAVESYNDEVPHDLLTSHHSQQSTTGQTGSVVVRGFEIPAPAHYTEAQARNWYDGQKSRAEEAADVLHPNLERQHPPVARPASIRLEESSQKRRTQPDVRRLYSSTTGLPRDRT